MSAVSPIFCRPSWTLFSPKSTWPAAAAARTASALNVLETAISLTVVGSRPARRAAASSRDLTEERFRTRATSTDGAVLLDVRLQHLGVRFRLGGVWTVRGNLQVGLELLPRFRQLALV